MNKKFIGLYLILVLASSSLYTPMNAITPSGKLYRFLGHVPVFSKWDPYYTLEIDYKKLLLQIIVVTVIFAILYCFLPDKLTMSKEKTNKTLG